MERKLSVPRSNRTKNGKGSVDKDGLLEYDATADSDKFVRTATVDG